MSQGRVPTLHWTLDDLRAGLLATLEGDRDGLGRFIHGRVVGVLASPEERSASYTAIGVSAVPAGCATPEHSHAAEEIAIILSGAGTIAIDGEVHPVSQGSVVLTPAESVHVTSASQDQPLLVLWMYAPAGSERRWLNPEQEEGTF